MSDCAVLEQTGTAAASKTLMTEHECAARLNIKWRTWRRLVDAGKAPFGIRLRSLRRWQPDEIEEWIAKGCQPVR